MHEADIKSGKLKPTMSFYEKVWAITSRIPRGKVVSYGEIARILKCKGARAVGQALNKNPYAPQVPCHRVVGSDRKLTGFASGLKKKQQMLEAEGVKVEAGRVESAAIVHL